MCINTCYLYIDWLISTILMYRPKQIACKGSFSPFNQTASRLVVLLLFYHFEVGSRLRLVADLLPVFNHFNKIAGSLHTSVLILVMLLNEYRTLNHSTRVNPANSHCGLSNAVRSHHYVHSMFWCWYLCTERENPNQCWEDEGKVLPWVSGSPGFALACIRLCGTSVYFFLCWYIFLMIKIKSIFIVSVQKHQQHRYYIDDQFVIFSGNISAKRPTDNKLSFLAFINTAWPHKPEGALNDISAEGFLSLTVFFSVNLYERKIPGFSLRGARVTSVHLKDICIFVFHLSRVRFLLWWWQIFKANGNQPIISIVSIFKIGWLAVLFQRNAFSFILFSSHSFLWPYRLWLFWWEIRFSSYSLHYYYCVIVKGFQLSGGWCSPPFSQS